MTNLDHVSALQLAEQELDRRAARADQLGDWKEHSILAPLAEVADYVKRIGDHRDSAHYRAEKTGPLLRSARRVQRETMLAYAGWPDDDSPAARLLDTADDLLGEVTSVLRSIMWSAACPDRGAPENPSDVAELSDVGHRLQAFATELAATAAARRVNSSPQLMRGPGLSM